jgi:polyisoprenoid-binding protein YceI
MTSTPNLERSLRYLLAWAPAVEAARSALAQRPVPDAVLNVAALTFVAHGTFGECSGSTSMATGAIRGGRDYTTTRGWVEVPLATFGTGNARRDRRLRAVLEVDRHPRMQVVLRGATVVSAALGARDVTTLFVRGRLTLRGVTRYVELLATVTRSASRTRVTSSFRLNLSDYGVVGLTRFLGLLRVRPLIEVRVDMWFVDRLPLFSDDASEPSPPA